MTRELWLARHGESVGNLAAARAETEASEVLDLDLADPVVPLTPTGEKQAGELGGWILEQPEPPRSVWCSPYLRARETARIALERADWRQPIAVDERLRDRELGVLDLLTTHGIEARFPDEAVRRRRLGKFWHRPPGGESWADVALRLRTVLPAILDAEGPVLVVAHDVVVSLIVYVCCGMSVEEALELARGRPVGNATVTTLRRDESGWRLAGFAEAGHLDHREARPPEGAEAHDV